MLSGFFIPLETCVSSSSFDMVGMQERKTHFSLLQPERRKQAVIQAGAPLSRESEEAAEWLLKAAEE